MPIYEYRCAKCGHEMEAIQKLSDSPLQTCPACKQDSLQKLVSAPSFRLKGSGWYETDFKKDNRKHLADDSKREENSGTGSSDKSGSSPEPKSKNEKASTAVGDKVKKEGKVESGKSTKKDS